MTNQRKWTSQLFKYLEESGFNPIGINFRDDYFIFDHGEDKVVHFHINELKGWKFGIWWNIDGEEQFDFFTQYEANIDKFKPSASTFVIEDCCLEDWSLKDCRRICQFIKKHPYVAWDIDCGCKRDIWDLADVEHPFFGFYQERLRYWWAEVCYRRFNKKYLKLVSEIADEYLISPQIIDENKNGWETSPRYFIKCKGMKEEDLKPGHYGIEFDTELSPSLKKKALKYEKSLKRKINQPWRTYDIDPVGRLCFTVVKEKE